MAKKAKKKAVKSTKAAKASGAGKGAARGGKSSKSSAPKRPAAARKPSAASKKSAAPAAKIVVRRAPVATRAVSRKSPARAAAIEAPRVAPPPEVIEDDDDDDDSVEEVVEPPLTAREIEEFREILVTKRAQIMGDMSTLKGEALKKNRQDASGDLSTMPIHMADLGSDNYELEFTLGLLEGESAVLKEIDEALERIKKGTYGVCVATGMPIGKARLKAKPWAKHCYQYALAQERSGRRA